MDARKTHRPTGFTLIELMVVTAIIGILASVAIPNLQRFTYRAKASERAVLMNRIKQQIADYYVRNGTSIPPALGTVVASGWNPPGYPPGTAKKVTSDALPTWNVYFSGPAGTGSVTKELEGAVYYDYYFQVQESPAGSYIWVWAYGDLDGDGSISLKSMTWLRNNGVYQLIDESPAAGTEDATTF